MLCGDQPLLGSETLVAVAGEGSWCLSRLQLYSTSRRVTNGNGYSYDCMTRSKHPTKPRQTGFVAYARKFGAPPFLLQHLLQQHH